jgi:hypothetical protein
MVTASAPGQLALASNDKTSPPALLEGLPGGEREIEFEHVRRSQYADGCNDVFESALSHI